MANGETLGVPTGTQSPLLSMLAQMFGGGGATPLQPSGPALNPALGAGGGGGSPGRVGAVPNPPQVPNVGGMQPAAGTPGVQAAINTPGVTEGGASRFPAWQPPNKDVEWKSPGGKSMAITQNALSAIGSSVRDYKQNQYQKKMQTAKAAVLQKAMQTMDPQAQAQMQKLAQSDPKFAKIFEKQQQDFVKAYDKAMTDPNSPEYYGFQQAYKELQAQAAYKDQMELVKAQMAAEYERGQQEAAHAELYRKQAEMEGQETPRVRYEEAQKNARITSQVQGSLQRVREQTKAMLEATQKRADALRDVAKIRGAAGGKGQNKALDYIAKDYKNIVDQINGLDKEAKALQDRVANHPIASWWNNEKEGMPARLQSIDQQRTTLQQRLQSLEAQRAQLLQAGTIPADAASDWPQTQGTPDDPIIVDESDMGKPSAGKK